MHATQRARAYRQYHPGGWYDSDQARPRANVDLRVCMLDQFDAVFAPPGAPQGEPDRAARRGGQIRQEGRDYPLLSRRSAYEGKLLRTRPPFPPIDVPP